MQTEQATYTYLDAIAAALMSEMEADPDVFIIGALNTPTPTSPTLEDAVVPQAARIAEVVRKVATE